MITTSRKQKSLSSLIRDADKVFSEYVRLRDTKDGRIPCFICGTSLTFAQACCMHYIRRGEYVTRFDEMNAHGGCEFCNAKDEYSDLTREQHKFMMLQKYGPEALNELVARSKSLLKMTRYECGEIIEKYRHMIKELKH